MSKILNVGIVGCGEVAMVTHLPTLLLCDHLFKTVALCDVSTVMTEHCSKKFFIPATYTSVTEMLKSSPEIDLVFILSANEYHASQAIECMNAGKHVMIEKPMALSHKDCDDIEAARIKNQVVAFVGYMRRYATAFLRVKEMVKKAKEINYVRVRDIIGPNSAFVAQCGAFPIPLSGIPQSANDDRSLKQKEIFTRAIGAERASNPKEVLFWSLLGGLASHDLSAMRELVGLPKSVLSATRKISEGGVVMVTVHFEFEGFTAYYEMSVDNVKKFDAHIEVITNDKHLKVTYDTPYVKGLPITATVLSTSAEGDFVEENIRPTYKDAYTLEYEDLYECIVNGKEVKTNPMDAKQELVMFDMILEKIKGSW